VKHSSGKTDNEFENMEFLELTSSEEHLLFEVVCNVSSDVPIVQQQIKLFLVISSEYANLL
jgi:hypothetical protein